MKYQPITNEAYNYKVEERKKAIESFRAWPKGEYPFTVHKAYDDVSKSSGKDMLVLELAVYNQEGHEKYIKCYLTAEMDFLIRHFCETCGIPDVGELTPVELEGKSGVVYLGIEKDKRDVPSDQKYPDKNKVADFVKPQASKPIVSAKDELEDEIPF